MADNFQRTGSISNSHVGRDFEDAAVRVLAASGITVSKNFPVNIGIGKTLKRHKFDLGSDSPPILVECKSHRWTTGGNVPSAKLTVWNEAMYYFHCAPPKYRKVMLVLHDERETTGETLASYYVRTHGHLVPEDVEIWEFDEASGRVEVICDA